MIQFFYTIIFISVGVIIYNKYNHNKKIKTKQAQKLEKTEIQNETVKEEEILKLPIDNKIKDQYIKFFKEYKEYDKALSNNETCEFPNTAAYFQKTFKNTSNSHLNAFINYSNHLIITDKNNKKRKCVLLYYFCYVGQGTNVVISYDVNNNTYIISFRDMGGADFLYENSNWDEILLNINNVIGIDEF